MISVIIPTYNEDNCITVTLAHIKESSGLNDYEIIISDGGSKDKTTSLAREQGCLIVNSAKGRGAQLNAGADAASGDILLFLHADTLLPDNFDNLIIHELSSSAKWGRFDIKLSGSQKLFRIIEKLISFRSRLTGIATGDQAIFIERDFFYQQKGFNDIPLMEDIEFTRRLKKLSKPACCNKTVITSSRRWEENGIIKTVFLMWLLRSLFFIGINPSTLVRLY